MARGPPQAQATPQPSHPSCPGAGGGPAGSPQREQEQSSARAPQARSGRGRSGSPDPAPLLTTAGRAGRWGPCAELPTPHRKPGGAPSRARELYVGGEPRSWAPGNPKSEPQLRARAPGSPARRPRPPLTVPSRRRHLAPHDSRGSQAVAGGQRPGAAGSVNSSERDAQPRSRARKRLARRWEGPVGEGGSAWLGRWGRAGAGSAVRLGGAASGGCGARVDGWDPAS